MNEKDIALQRALTDVLKYKSQIEMIRMVAEATLDVTEGFAQQQFEIIAESCEKILK